MSENLALQPYQEIMEIPRVDPAKRFEELGVFVMDGSFSMTETAAGNVTKGQAVNQAIRDTLSRFKVSTYKQCFEFAVVAFSDTAAIRLPPTPAIVVDELGEYDPTVGLSNGTNTWLGLEEAERLANNYLSHEIPGGVPRKVCIVLLSDGECSNESRTRAVADRIKAASTGSRTTLACVFLATVGTTNTQGQQLLRQIASSPALYATAYDGETLRKFFTRSMSTSAGIRRVE